MSPAPLPPHERPWRHPSELAPTRIDVDHGSRRLAMPLVVGSTTMLLVVALVVAMTPSPSAQPAAQSVTTVPARAADEPDRAIVRLALITPIPNAVAAIPTFSVDDGHGAERMPHPDETVIVQTKYKTYHLTWRDVQWLEVDGRAVIVDRWLDIVGYLDDGRFYPTIGR